jgi:hypothetical protein
MAKTTVKTVKPTKAEKQSIEEISKTTIDMLKKLCSSDNEDIKMIAFLFTGGNDKNRVTMYNHYKTNGSELINAIFKGDLKTVVRLCSEHDERLLKSVK